MSNNKKIKKDILSACLHRKALIFLFFIFSIEVQANDFPLLERIVTSILSERNVINREEQYELSLINQRYQYLQWWQPSVALSNNLLYPYKTDFYDDLATGNQSTLNLLLPLPTGTVFNISSSYSLVRDLLEISTLERLKWGYTQDIEFSIGLTQSLNPWWLHSRRNPYSNNAAIQSSLSRNDYNLTIKGMLFSEVETYINLRKIERSIIHLKETLIIYDEYLQAQQQLLNRGSITWREYEKTRLEKWDYETALFRLESDRAYLQGELYRLTGTLIENVNYEFLPCIEDALFMSVFLDTQRESINTLEETSLNLMRESLQMTRLLNRQENAPSISIGWSTLYKLPVSSSSSLGDVWKRDNFDNNIRNNWNFTITLNLSSLVSPINRMQTLQYREQVRTIDELLNSLTIEKQYEKDLNNLIIIQTQEQIERLSVLVANDEVRIQENLILKDRGVISALEFGQAELIYKEKQTLLFNLKDDLWLYTFIRSFY